MAVPTAAYQKPLPKMEPEARPYWEYLRQHQMHLQQCQDCSRFYFLPSTRCSRCLSANVEWKQVSGRGRVWSCVTMHRAYQPAYKEEIPYNVSVVELDEGPKVWTNVIGCAPSDVRVGMQVEVVYEDVTPEITLAKFKPRG